MLQMIRTRVISNHFSTSFNSIVISSHFSTSVKRSIDSSSIPSSKNVRRGRSRKNERKVEEDNKWELEQSMNPFVRNTGAFRSLKHSGLDPDEPGLAENLGAHYMEDDLTIENVIMESKAYKKKYQVDEVERKFKAKKKMIQKSVFPKAPNPNLLTWIEKETIKYLHKLDPIEWSVNRLADSFPATPGVIHKVLRNKGGYATRARMIQYDEEVKENWKMLTEGKLEIDPKLHEHLASSNRKELGLSSGQVNQMEHDILESYENHCNLLPRPVVPGQFGSIIVDYKKKLEAANNPPELNAEAPDLIEMERLFGDNSIPGTPMRNEVSSWGETAILASDIDLARERYMDIDQFRKRYQKPRTRVEEVEESDNNPYRKKYLKWLDQEKSRSLEQTSVVPRLSEADVSEVRDTSWIEKRVGSTEDGIAVHRGVSEHSKEEEVFVFDEKSGYKKPFVTPDYPDTIEIPKELRRRHRMYRVNDCYYDQDGEFAYRVPGLK